MPEQLVGLARFLRATYFYSLVDSFFVHYFPYGNFYTKYFKMLSLRSIMRSSWLESIVFFQHRLTSIKMSKNILILDERSNCHHGRIKRSHSREILNGRFSGICLPLTSWPVQTSLHSEFSNTKGFNSPYRVPCKCCDMTTLSALLGA